MLWTGVRPIVPLWPPGIVDVAADRDAGLVLTDGIAKRHTAGVPPVLLLIGNAVGRRMRNQHRPRGT